MADRSPSELGNANDDETVPDGTRQHRHDQTLMGTDPCTELLDAGASRFRSDQESDDGDFRMCESDDGEDDAPMFVKPPFQLLRIQPR